MKLLPKYKETQFWINSFDEGKDYDIHAGDIFKEYFFRIVTPEHFMRKHSGYGIQEEVFESLLSKNIQKIIFIRTQEKDTLKSLIQDWLSFGLVTEYGHGKQRFLDIKHMKRAW